MSLPDLGIEAIKAKIDTGARTSALHAFDVGPADGPEGEWVRFRVHPRQRDSELTVECRARLTDHRWVRSSSGKATLRPVILTTTVVGGESLPIELTLVSRDAMGFRMLLGRQAIRRRFLVDPGRSYLTGKRRSPKEPKKETQ